MRALKRKSIWNVKNAVSEWPAAGQGFKFTKWPAVWYFCQILRNERDPSNSNYHVSINNRQAIQKSFIDRRSNAWLMLGSEGENVVRDTLKFLGRSFQVSRLALLAERKPRLRPATYTALLDRLAVVNRHMIVWIGWVPSIPQIWAKYQTAGDLVIWKPWPAAGHLDTYQKSLTPFFALITKEHFGQISQ